MGIEEYAASGKQVQSLINGAYRTISDNESISFSLYNKQIISDGTVFWVKAINEDSIAIVGSLHASTDQKQNSDETIGQSSIKFTTQEHVQDFLELDKQSILIGSFGALRFAFTANSPYFQAADTWHYWGDAIYPIMNDLIIDDPNSFDPAQVVTNSLPIWLSLTKVNDIKNIAVYPEFLVPNNLLPPYSAILVKETKPISAMPLVWSDSSSDYLAMDTVKVVTYGLRNVDVQDYIASIFNAQIDGYFGFSNYPVPKDEKYKQSELNILSIKKSFEFKINYYQSVVRDIARQLIVDASTTVAQIPAYS